MKIPFPRGFTTVNKIPPPVGLPVRLRLQAEDVIHSFRVPELGGRMDLIPGRENELRLPPSAPAAIAAHAPSSAAGSTPIWA